MSSSSTTLIPVLIGPAYRHVMGSVAMLEEGNSVKLTISVTAVGQDASDLVAILASGEPQAVQFVAIPVTPRSTQSKETI